MVIRIEYYDYKVPISTLCSACSLLISFCRAIICSSVDNTVTDYLTQYGVSYSFFQLLHCLHVLLPQSLHTLLPFLLLGLQLESQFFHLLLSCRGCSIARSQLSLRQKRYSQLNTYVLAVRMKTLSLEISSASFLFSAVC